MDGFGNEVTDESNRTIEESTSSCEARHCSRRPARAQKLQVLVMQESKSLVRSMPEVRLHESRGPPESGQRKSCLLFLFEASRKRSSSVELEPKTPMHRNVQGQSVQVLPSPAAAPNALVKPEMLVLLLFSTTRRPCYRSSWLTYLAKRTPTSEETCCWTPARRSAWSDSLWRRNSDWRQEMSMSSSLKWEAKRRKSRQWSTVFTSDR